MLYDVIHKLISPAQAGKNADVKIVCK